MIGGMWQRGGFRIPLSDAVAAVSLSFGREESDEMITKIGYSLQGKR
jgi:hypothetical protein